MKNEYEKMILDADARMKQLEKSGTKRDKAKHDELVKVFKKEVGTFVSGPVELEPIPQSYGSDSDMSIRMNYQGPEDKYGKELMTIELEGVDKDGETSRYYFDKENPPITMRFKRLSFYTTSGWDETELHRCILIGRVADAMNILGDEIGKALFKVVMKYREAILEGHEKYAEQETLKKKAEQAIEDNLFDSKTKFGVRYLIGLKPVKDDDDRGNRNYLTQITTGYARWDYYHIKAGMSYEFVRESPTKYEVKIYEPVDGQDEPYIRKEFKNKIIFKNMVRELLSRKDVTLTAVNI